MKKSFLYLFIGIALLQAHHSQAAGPENLLGCRYHNLDSSNDENRGSFLNLIEQKIKPGLDKFAKEGYLAANGDTLVRALDSVDKKVKRQVLSSLRGESRDKLKKLKSLGDKLAGKTVNLYTLPGMLGKFSDVKDRYKLSTYIGLVSCGGMTLKLADDNFAYNIHYGSGSERKDKQTGRSFGASRVFKATDASYSHYLRTLESYVTNSPENVKDFMQTIMETLTNANPRGYEQVTNQGDAVLTDFFAIWTAEQTRNLMDKKVDLHWDSALLQVTLLSAFHAGQDKITLFSKDPLTGKVSFTNKTHRLAWPRKNHKTQSCESDLESRSVKDADLKDYIGVHYATYEHCGRSGINMSRNEWKKLSRGITAYMMSDKTGKKLVQNVRRHFKGTLDLTKNEYGKTYRSYEKDILRELARFLINDKTPKVIESWKELSSDTTELLEYMRLKANDITAVLAEKD